MKTKKKWLDAIVNILLCVCIIGCTFLIAFKTTFIKVVVNGSSMNPNIEDGSLGYMYKVRKVKDVKRFDVVVSQYDSNRPDYYIIKRVLGMPNEEIDLIDNQLFVNGNKIEQDFAFNKRVGNFATTHWSLGEDQFLLVGDNREHTMQPAIEPITSIIAKNGFSYATYDINSQSCAQTSDYSACPIKHRTLYYFKDGINS